VRDVNGVSPDFFATMGMVLREGRTFTAADRIGPTRTIINEAMARQLWPGESAIGKHIAHPIEREWQEVIGVVSDVSFPTNLNTPRTPFQTYRLLAREPARDIALELRTSADPSAMVNAVRRAVAELDPELPVQGLGSASDTVERGLADALIVTGTGTGEATNIADLETVRRACPNAKILLGSGVSAENVWSYSQADGFIVGSSLKTEGKLANPVDPQRVAKLVKAMKGA